MKRAVKVCSSADYSKPSEHERAMARLVNKTRTFIAFGERLMSVPRHEAIEAYQHGGLLALDESDNIVIVMELNYAL